MVLGDRRGDRQPVPAPPAAGASGRGEGRDARREPGPSSETSIRTRSLVARTRTRTTPPPCSAALPTRFAHAWAIRSGSANDRRSAPRSRARGATRGGGAARGGRARRARTRRRARRARDAAGAASKACDGQRRFDPQLGAVPRGQCSPRGRVGLDQLGQVDEFAARAGRAAGGGGGEVLQRAAGAGQLELDRGQARGLAAEAVETELHGEQRAAQLVGRAGDQDQPAVRAQPERDERRASAPSWRP